MPKGRYLYEFTGTMKACMRHAQEGQNPGSKEGRWVQTPSPSQKLFINDSTWQRENRFSLTELSRVYQQLSRQNPCSQALVQHKSDSMLFSGFFSSFSFFLFLKKEHEMG